MPYPITLLPLAEVSNPQIEAGINTSHPIQLAHVAQLAHVFKTEQVEQVDEQVAKNRFTSAPASCYIDSVAPVKRDRAWTPVESAATKAAVSAYGLRLFHSCPFMAARWAGASLAGSRKRVPGSPTHRAAALIGLRAAVFENRTCLEANMAISFCATAPASPATGTAARLYPAVIHGLSLTDPRCADVLNALPGLADPAPVAARTPDPIQLHADVHNALSMAVFYLRQPQANTAAARRKAIQALTALRGLSLALEG